MCVLANLTCGSCLAKWNGKTWEESYKCIFVLKTWTVVLNEEHELCVKGQCDFDINVTVCVPITNYVTRYWVVSGDAILKLRGDLKPGNIPEYVAKKFSDGVPTNWKEVGRKWVQYIQQGERGAFDWRGEESFTTSDTSILLARTDRNFTSGRNGKTKDKSAQSIQQETSKNTREPECDSAVCSADDSSLKKKGNVTSEAFACPWLPAHKVQEINQWIDCSQVPPAPLADLEINAGRRRSSLDLLCSSDSTSSQISQKRREQISDRVARNLNAIPQSTPLSNQLRSRNAAEILNFELSSIADLSRDSLKELTSSADSELVDGVFRKPKTAVPGAKVATSKNNVRSERSNSKISQTASSLESKSNTSGGTGKRVTTSSSLRLRNRPRRKPPSQRIERWRPVLGVDKNLKVQGYLLLSGNMTAGQILTTNSVVQWGYRKVETCDGREYELIGEPYEKIPEDLRENLLKPISCEDIIKKLETYQSLKDRSDWGAEYELFYGNDSAYGTNSSRMSSSTSRRDTRASRNIPSTTHGSDAEFVRTPACDVTKTSEKATHRLSGSSQKRTSSSESVRSSPSPVRKSSRITERQLQGKYLRWKNKKRRRTNTILNSSSESEEMGEISHDDSAAKSIEKERNLRNSRNEVRLSSENVNLKGSQNQMMLPSLRLASESSIVHFSPSRIKVSYLSNSPNVGQKAVQTIPQSPSERSMLDGSTDTSEDMFTFRQSRNLNEPISPTHRQFVPHSSPILRTPVRVASQSLVSRVTGRRSLQSLDRRNLSASAAGLAKKTPTNPVTKILHEVSAVKSPTKIAIATKTPTVRTMTKTPTATQTAKRTTKTPGVKTTNKNLGTKTATKSPTAATSNIETPSTKVSKTFVTRSRSSRTPITKTHSESQKTSKTPIPETSLASKSTSAASKTRSSRISTSKTPSYKTSETSSSKTPAPKTPPKTRKGSSVKRRNNQTPCGVSSVGKTAASKPSYSIRKSASGSLSSQRKKNSKVNQPLVIVKRLNVKDDFPNVEKDNKELTPRSRQTKSRKEIKPVAKKIGSPKSASKKNGRPKSVERPQKVGRLKKMDKKDTEKTGRTKNTDKKDMKKETTKTKTIKEKKKSVKKASFFDSSDENETADEDASVCSNVSDMSLGPSASVVFAMDSPTSRRAPRTLKERRERDERLAQMERRLAVKETVTDDDDPMAHLFASYKFANIPEEWCKHENILRQNRKRRRPSSSDGTASPRSVFDDGFGYEDATSSVATPQLLMKPPDPKQVQSYLQRQRALNSRPQRSTRQVYKNTNLMLPDIDYGAIFCPNTSDSEASSMVSDAD